MARCEKLGKINIWFIQKANSILYNCLTADYDKKNQEITRWD